ncbi:hypothetical protein LCGC14_0993140 [marine sediment metagenome]|uniref:GTPase-associated system helical domain-containing protein n=1 Tax=marine sediment metagenome TaxID=412755 RepID=A0A0F9NRN6_9ZZZZ
MNPEFGVWYLQVDPEPTDDKLKRRWQAIEKLCKKPSRDLKRDLIRIAYQVPSPATTSQALVGACQDADAAFRAHDNAEEQSLLAAVAIVNLFDSKAQADSISLALGVTCASLQGNRSRKTAEEVGLHRRADEHLATVSLASRCETLQRKAGPAPVNVDGTCAEAKAHAEQNAIPDAVKKLADAVQSIGAGLDGILDVFHRLERQQGLFAEELNILWWMENGTSRVLQKKLKRMNPGSAALVAGKELADITRVPPGPLGIVAFLAHAIPSPSSRITFAAAVEAVPEAWRLDVLVDGPVTEAERLCPLHVALREAVKSSTWHEAFSHSTGIDATVKIRPVDVALQMYRECLLLESDLAG